jgi:hypothetical protein
MTFRELWDLELTKRLSSVDTTRLFTIARRQAAVNRGAMTFARLTSCCQADAPIGLPLNDGEAWRAVSTPDSAFYGFSPQGVLLRRQNAAGKVWDTPLTRRGSEWMDRYRPGWRVWGPNAQFLNGGLPEEYIWWPGNFYGLSTEAAAGNWGRDGIVSVFPCPFPSQFTGEVWQLVAIQWEIPATMTNDTDLPFVSSSSPSPSSLESYHPAIADFAAYQLEKLRRDAEAQDARLQAFNEHVQRYLSSHRQRGGDEVIDTLGSMAVENSRVAQTWSLP